MELKVKLTDGAPLPKHAKPGDAALDLTSRQNVTIPPHCTRMVGTGVAVEIPDGYVGLVFPRSGLASKRGVNLANCVGVIDSGYRGEVMVPLHNNNPVYYEPEDNWKDGGWADLVRMNMEGIVTVERGERVAQLVIVPFATCECFEVEELSETERGKGGFGSTGM